MLAGSQYDSHIEEFAANCILGKRIYPKAAVGLIVREFPKATGLDVVFALVSIAESVQLWLPKDRFEEVLPFKIFEACALLGADLFAMEKLGIYPATCGALAEYWGDEESYFVADQP